MMNRLWTTDMKAIIVHINSRGGTPGSGPGGILEKTNQKANRTTVSIRS